MSKFKFPRNKIVWNVLAILIILGAAYYIGNNQGKTAQNTSSASQPTNSFQSPAAKHGPLTQQQVQDQSKKAVQDTKLQPSSGHLNLSGNITDVSESSIGLKLANGQTVTFSVPTDVLVMLINTGTKTVSAHSAVTKHSIKDVKKGQNATVMITVSSDGTFVVRSIRAYAS